jgi:DNA-binding Xre family transcriptional regulator
MKETTKKVTYTKLLKLLIDRKMSKNELRKLTGISSTTMAKLSKSGNVNTNVLVCICEVLDCDICDIMEINKEK